MEKGKLRKKARPERRRKERLNWHRRLGLQQEFQGGTVEREGEI